MVLTLVTSSIANFFLMGSLSVIMSMIVFMQIGSHYSLVNIGMPASAVEFNSGLATVISFDFYDVDDHLDSMFDYD